MIFVLSIVMYTKDYPSIHVLLCLPVSVARLVEKRRNFLKVLLNFSIIHFEQKTEALPVIA